MKKAFSLFTAGLCLVCTFSCRGLSPFIRNGRTELLQYAGAEGEIVVYFNLRKAGPSFAMILKTNTSSLLRFQDAVILADAFGISGVLEGDVPIVGKSVVIDLFHGKKIEHEGMTFYCGKSGERILYFDLVYPGVILFSTTKEGYINVYKRFFVDKKKYIQPQYSAMMQFHEVCVYGVNPVSNASDMLKEGYLSGLLLLMDNNGKSGYNVNGWLQAKDKESFKAVNTIMNQHYMEDVKERGEKLDLPLIAKSMKVLNKEFSINYLNFEMSDSLFLKMFGGGF